MPVGFNSPARNLFLLGSTGAQLVTNFFKTINLSSGTDGNYIPDEIRFNVSDQKFLFAGTASDSNSRKFGWFEKRTDGGISDWEVKVQSTITSFSQDTSLNALEIDGTGKLIVVGKTGSSPWIAKYTTGGLIEWQIASQIFDVSYTGISVDSSNNIYVCGNDPTTGNFSDGFIEKYNSSGTPQWGKSAFFFGRDVILTKCFANSRGEVIAVGIIEDDSAFKGYIVKLDADTGDILWDRTLRSYKPDPTLGYEGVFCEDLYVDGNDNIFIVGRLYGGSETRSFIVKYSPEGNIVWQRETPAGQTIEFYQVKSDTETGQTIVFGEYYGLGGILSKYSNNGDLLWRRVIYSSYNSSTTFGSTNLDADPSHYYILYTDSDYNALSGAPKRYTFGKVSSSGNGFGNFTYSEGTGQTIYYQILNVQDKIGRLSDGSVRQDTSDLLAYPFNANKILFDDFATQITNKKVQIDEPDVFNYSGTVTPTIFYPSISPYSIVYGSNLILNYDFKNKASYPGGGFVYNLSNSLNYIGTITEATFNSAGYFVFDGTNDYIEHATGSFPITGNAAVSLEGWFYFTGTNGTGDYKTFFAYGNGPSAGDTIALGLFDNFRLSASFNGGLNAQTAQNTLPTNVWKHLLVTKSPGAINTTTKIYMNGVEQTITSAPADVPSFSSRVIRLGRWTNESAGYYYQGRIGEVRIYNKALSAAEVSQNFNATRAKYGV